MLAEKITKGAIWRIQANSKHTGLNTLALVFSKWKQLTIEKDTENQLCDLSLSKNMEHHVNKEFSPKLDPLLCYFSCS